jgi:hypothetical protein
VAQEAPDRCLVFLTRVKWWNSILQALPPSALSHAHPYYGTLLDFQSGRALPDCGALEGSPVVLMLRSFGASGFDAVEAATPERVVARGVLILQGPLPARPLPPPPPPLPGSPVVAWATALALLVVLVVVGSGWSVGLLPPDPVTRVGLAPALGMSMLMFASLGWSAAGFPVRGASGIAPAIGATAIGWVVALAVRRRRGRTAVGPPASAKPGLDDDLGEPEPVLE